MKPKFVRCGECMCFYVLEVQPVVACEEDSFGKCLRRSPGLGKRSDEGYVFGEHPIMLATAGCWEGIPKPMELRVAERLKSSP